MDAPKKRRSVDKKIRRLLNRLDKKLGTHPGFHLWMVETSADELGNVIIEKAKKECTKI